MRKQTNIDEMLKAPTVNRYLEEVTNQATAKIRKKKIVQDKKKCILYCIPKLKHYAAAPDATDEVLELLEGICDESLNEIEVIRNMRVLFQHYEFFDAHKGEASKCKNILQKIEVKYKPHSPHSQSEVSHFREQMEGFY